MTSLAVLSAKASPGVTTAALLLAAALPESALLVEADGDGGSLGARFGLRDEPGLRTLAVRARRGLEPASVIDHTQPIGDVPVLVGPASAEEASAVLCTLAESMGEAMRAIGHTTIVDAGRARPNGPAWPLVSCASLRLVICRPRLDEFRPAASLVAELQRDGRPVGLLCVGAGPYSPNEFAAEAGAELWGVLPDDARAAASLRGEPANPRVLQRSRLWLTAAALVERLTEAEVDDREGHPPQRSVLR